EDSVSESRQTPEKTKGENCESRWQSAPGKPLPARKRVRKNIVFCDRLVRADGMWAEDRDRRDSYFRSVGAWADRAAFRRHRRRRKLRLTAIPGESIVDTSPAL